MSNPERLRVLARVMVLLAEIAEGHTRLTLLSVVRSGAGADRRYQTEDGSTQVTIYAADRTGWGHVVRIRLADGVRVEARDLNPIAWYQPSPLEQAACWGIGTYT